MLTGILVLVCGLIIGSFISAYTYRTPRNLSVIKGRSICPKCKTKISWYDNVPIVSYFFLKGRCRNCNKKISARYPLIEFSTAIIFLVSFFAQGLIRANVPWLMLIPDYIFLPFVIFLVSIFISIFVIDTEQQIIPDELIFIALCVAFLILILSGYPKFYENLLASLASALFLLLLHILTRGAGMGLGDVKLAILIGLLLGINLGVLSIFLSFILGGAVALFLLILKKAHLGQRIAFGPFMIASYFIVMFFGDKIVSSVFPF